MEEEYIEPPTPTARADRKTVPLYEVLDLYRKTNNWLLGEVYSNMVTVDNKETYMADVKSVYDYFMLNTKRGTFFYEHNHPIYYRKLLDFVSKAFDHFQAFTPANSHYAHMLMEYNIGIRRLYFNDMF